MPADVSVDTRAPRYFGAAVVRNRDGLARERCVPNGRGCRHGVLTRLKAVRPELTVGI